MNTRSYWIDTAPSPVFSQLDRDLRVDVLVVGGGITGLTTAYLLRKAGRSVALLERGTIGKGETGYTSAHLTYATDMRLSNLVKAYGEDRAREVWKAGAAAMTQIETIVTDHRIECELRPVPAFLVAAVNADLPLEAERLRNEAAMAAKLGFEATFVDEVPLFGRPGMLLANQFKFHPMLYLQALAREVARMGVQVFERTEVSEFHEEPREAIARSYRVSYGLVALATHVPLQGNRSTLSAALLQTKLIGRSTYLIEARLPSARLPEMIWWDTDDPYLYLRLDRHENCDVVLLGGEDHKTGQKADTNECFYRLEQKLHSLMSDACVERRWSGQVIETVDGLPYIGEVGERQFLATGFAGNGMTFGTLAGMMARDFVCATRNPWRELFAVDRRRLGASWEYVRENADYPYYLARGYLSAEEAAANCLECGEGRIVRIDGRKVAMCCDDEGTTHAVSAICPHLGCVVAWNEAEQTWDCPCHGSRFAAAGKLISGPAEIGLEKVQLECPV